VINREVLILDEPFSLQETLIEFELRYSDRKSLLAGLDIVLHDYFSRRLNLPLWQYLGIPSPYGKHSSYTISIDKPDNLVKRLEAAKDFPAVKVKIGSEYDRENLEMIHSTGQFKIRVDANSAFEYDQFIELVPLLNKLEVEMVEQPLADSKPEELMSLKKELQAPIYLDESIVEVEDIYRYAQSIDGINIKLQRVGGIRQAMKMIQVAKSLDLGIMFGCMLETSIGNTAAAHLAGFANFLDLDSSFLLKHDLSDGIKLDHGKIQFPDRPGIGVKLK
jgi:L-alanine-DL-glutamate epimerase-like enolase superfamily enzyme